MPLTSLRGIFVIRLSYSFPTFHEIGPGDYGSPRAQTSSTSNEATTASGTSPSSTPPLKNPRSTWCKKSSTTVTGRYPCLTVDRFAVIGHLKSDHRMIRNYLKGTLGDAINTLMAAAAYNMRHWMNKNALSSFVSWLKTLVGRLENVIFENVNIYARHNSNLAIAAK